MIFLAFSLDDELKQILDLGIFVIKENLKIRINGPYYHNILFGWKESAEKQKKKKKKSWILHFIIC